MSVFIRGLNLPAEPMILILHPDGNISTEDYEIVANAKAIELPPHGRLIDADALTEKVIAKYIGHERNGKLVFAAAEIKQDIVDLISAAPPIIPAEEGE